MKCLFCNEVFTNNLDVSKNHYVDFFKIDSNSRFLKVLFKHNVVTSKSVKCHICSEMVFAEANRKKHNFLKDNGEVSRNETEDKPLNYSNLGDIEIDKVKFSEPKNYYDFYNSEEIVEEFLKNVRNIFQNNS